MNKRKLIDFISRYHLGGSVNDVIWSVQNKSISTKFTSEEREVSGDLKLKNFDAQAFDKIKQYKLGIGDSKQLLRFLNALDDEIDFEYVKPDHTGDIFNLKLSDQKCPDSFATFVLTSIEAISPVIQLDNISDFELEIIVDDDFVGNIIGGQKALNEVELFTIQRVDKQVEIIIGNSSIATNRYRFRADINTTHPKIDKISFPLRIFKEILLANKGLNSLLRISRAGFAHLNFEDRDFEANYYLRAYEDLEY